MAFYQALWKSLFVHAISLILFTIYSIIYLFIIQPKNDTTYDKTHLIIYIIIQSVYIFISIIASIFTIWTIVSFFFLQQAHLQTMYQALSQQLTMQQIIYIFVSTVLIQFFLQVAVLTNNIRIFLKKLNVLDNPHFMRKLDLAVLGINSIALGVFFIILFTKKRLI